MKKLLIIIFIFCILLCTIFAGCMSPHSRLRDALAPFSEMLQGEIPDDMHLTIYYVSPSLLFPTPLSKEGIMKISEEVIVVHRQELVRHLDLFQETEPRILEPVDREVWVDAQIYYVLESEETGKVLEVIINSTSQCVLINGVFVENSSVFYDVIIPFLSEKAHRLLGI